MWVPNRLSTCFFSFPFTIPIQADGLQTVEYGQLIPTNTHTSTIGTKASSSLVRFAAFPQNGVEL